MGCRCKLAILDLILLGPILLFFIFFAFLPALIYLRLIFKRDKFEPEPTGLVIRTFIYGVFISVVIAGMLNTFAVSILGEVLFFLIGVGLIEETSKIYGVKKLAEKTGELDNPTDGMVYGAAVGLGFAATENVLYGLVALQAGLISWGVLTVMRTLISMVLHMVLSAIVGSQLGKLIAEGKKDIGMSNIFTAKRFWFSVFMHNLFDTFLIFYLDIAIILNIPAMADIIFLCAFIFLLTPIIYFLFILRKSLKEERENLDKLVHTLTGKSLTDIKRIERLEAVDMLAEIDNKFLGHKIDLDTYRALRKNIFDKAKGPIQAIGKDYEILQKIKNEKVIPQKILFQFFADEDPMKVSQSLARLELDKKIKRVWSEDLGDYVFVKKEFFGFSLIRRAFKNLTLSRRTFEEIYTDPTATTQSLIIILFVAISNTIAIWFFIPDIFIASFTFVLSLAVLGAFEYVALFISKFLGKDVDVTFGEFSRTINYAFAPMAIINFFSFILTSQFYLILYLISVFWTLILLFVTTYRALNTGVFVWFASVTLGTIFGILTIIFGPTLYLLYLELAFQLVELSLIGLSIGLAFSWFATRKLFDVKICDRCGKRYSPKERYCPRCPR